MKLVKSIMDGNVLFYVHQGITYENYQESSFHKWCSGARHVTNSRKWCSLGKLLNMEMCGFMNTRVSLMNLIIKS